MDGGHRTTATNRNRGLAGWLPSILLLLVAVGCGGDSPAIGDLLLGPGDFPGQAVTRTGFQVGQGASGEPTGYVELAGPGFALQYSLVKFDSEGSARAVLAAVKQQWEQLARTNSRFTLVQPELAQLRVSGRELVSRMLVESGGPVVRRFPHSPGEVGSWRRHARIRWRSSAAAWGL